MISEFMHFDAITIVGGLTYKHLAIIPFGLGVLILAYYYLWHRHRHPEELETM
jgi:hypothetical protein